MSLIITLTPASGSPIVYTELGWSMTANVGKYALTIDQGTGIDDIRRMRTPGCNGNLVIRCGEMNRTVKMSVRYIGDTINYCEAAYVTDFNTLRGSGGKCSIGYSGQTITGCTLIPSSVTKQTKERNTGYPVSGNLTQVFVDVSMMFIKDAY